MNPTVRDGGSPTQSGPLPSPLLLRTGKCWGRRKDPWSTPQPGPSSSYPHSAPAVTGEPSLSPRRGAPNSPCLADQTLSRGGPASPRPPSLSWGSGAHWGLPVPLALILPGPNKSWVRDLCFHHQAAGTQQKMLRAPHPMDKGSSFCPLHTGLWPCSHPRLHRGDGRQEGGEGRGGQQRGREEKRESQSHSRER